MGDFEVGIVSSWALQLDIMMHRATKCVLSHDGIGTTIEGVCAGQPFITSPVTSDQLSDTKVMLHLGICVGTMAINTMESVMTRTDMEPKVANRWRKTIREVFERAFRADAETALANARFASKTLRGWMLDIGRKSGSAKLEDLRNMVSRPEA